MSFNKNKIWFVIALTVAVFASTNGYASKLFYTDSSKVVLKLRDNRPNRPVFQSFNTDFESFLKVYAIKKTSHTDLKISEADKPLDNVKIYPNPVSSQINISYSLKKDNQVTIKILDVLGNEVATLFNQRMLAGEQSNSFTLNSRISSGLYFIRIVAGGDAIIKRISVI